jgi:hypothetical protein
MTSIQRWLGASLVPLAVLASCGGGQRDAAQPVVIPEGPDAAPTAIAVSEDASAPEPAAKVTPPPMPPGANGPKDAVGMIGDAGKIVPANPTTTLLVNSAVMRAHPLGNHAMRVLTSVLTGWGEFMPMDLVHPVRDVDWVVLAGSLVMGSTQTNVFLAHYNLPEKKADTVSADLMKRLANGKKTQLGVTGGTSFSATVDGAERAYLRPKPGVLAIVPAADGKRVAEILKAADIPTTLRPGELARVSWPNAQRLPLPVPRGVKSLRVWINGTSKDELSVVAEGECADEEAALRAVDGLRNQLKANAPGFARMLLRPVIDDATIWADGNVVRYEAKLPDALLDMIASIACERATGSPNCLH